MTRLDDYMNEGLNGMDNLADLVPLITKGVGALSSYMLTAIFAILVLPFWCLRKLICLIT